MVTNVTSFGRSGLSDFVLQRVSAVVLALYTLCIVGYFLTRSPVDHFTLLEYLGSFPMQVFSTLAVLSLIAHGWIGMWTIGTDYIREHYFGSKALVCRLFFQGICLFTLFFYLVWALKIIWRL